MNFKPLASQRTKDDVARMAQYFERLPYFQGLQVPTKATSTTDKQQLINESCKQLKYRNYKEGEEIIRFGDVGDEFFIIMEGKVSVQTPKTVVINLPEAYEALTSLLLDSRFESFYDDDFSVDFVKHKS